MELDKIDPSTYLISMVDALPEELKHLYEKLQTLYQRKLWYQLTLTLQDILSRPSSAPFQVGLFENFVRHCEKHVNQLKLVEMGVIVAQQYFDGNEARDFLDGLAKQVDTPTTQEAFVLATMEAAQFKLLLGDLEATKSSMSRCEKILDSLNNIETTVHASFYRVSGDYHKAKAEYAGYYKNSLLYLACINVDQDLTPIEQVQIAHDLALSALLSPTIYNFGELLMHPILDSLSGTEHEWIKKMLFAFNEGNIGKYDSLAPNLPRQPILQANHSFLRQKICLMALIETVFRRPAGDRILRFSEVAQETHLPEDEVEHLVMKALSLKLIRGTIDQVERTIQITWVQPRVLDRHQIDGLHDRLSGWCSRVAAIGEFATKVAPDLFVQ